MTTPRKRVAVIMAGGSGERFWPLSRKDRPKQLLRLTDAAETMLHDAVNRIAPLIPTEDVYVVTGEHLLGAIREAGIGIPDANVIAEPCKRNTAGCLAYAAAFLLSKYDTAPGDLTMVVTTADHLIGEEDAFRATVEAAASTAESAGALATMGIVPTRPETGYGYIEVPEGAQPLNANGGPQVLPVQAFREKPDAETAAVFAATGRHFWNSGMFCWTLQTFIDEMRAAQPAIADAIDSMVQAMKQGDDAAMRARFEQLEDISIDYALMEQSKQVIVARAEFPWDDVGAWPALDRTRRSDADGNVAIGNPVLIDSTDCIVYNAPGAEQVALAVVGCEGLVVVTTPDGVLVIPKDRAQDVKKAVKALQARDATQL